MLLLLINLNELQKLTSLIKIQFCWNATANATRMCTENGQWYFDAEHNTTWSNYTECIIRQKNVKLHLQVFKWIRIN